MFESFSPILNNLKLLCFKGSCVCLFPTIFFFFYVTLCSVCQHSLFVGYLLKEVHVRYLNMSYAFTWNHNDFRIVCNSEMIDLKLS